MPGRDVKLTNGEPPAAGDPRVAAYLEMQSSDLRRIHADFFTAPRFAPRTPWRPNQCRAENDGCRCRAKIHLLDFDIIESLV